MSPRFTFFLVFAVLAAYFYQADGAALIDKGRKCIQDKTYSDGCNSCFCSGNRIDDQGAWEPIVGCTLMMCYTPDGKPYQVQDAPSDFWEV